MSRMWGSSDNNGNFLETDIFTWRIIYENVIVEWKSDWLERRS